MNKKIIMFLVAMLVVTTLFIYNVYTSVTTTYRNISTQIEVQQQKRVYLSEMYKVARERSLILLGMLSQTDAFELDESMQAFNQQARRFITARHSLMQQELNAEELVLLDTQNAITVKNARLQNLVAELLINGEKDRALTLLFETAIPVQNKSLVIMGKTLEINEQSSRKLVEEINQKLDRAGVRFGLFLTVFISVFVFILFYVYRASRTEQELLTTNLMMQRRVSHQLKASADKLSQFTDALSTFTFMLSPDGKVELVNKTATSSTGLSAESFIGKYLYDCYWWDCGAEAAALLKEDIRQGALGHSVDRTLTLKVVDGKCIIVRFILTPIKGARGEVNHLVAEAQDITEREKNAEKISYQASHDALTGLINRYEFERRLQLLLQAFNKTRVHFVCYLDLDQFKVVNDTCGHSAGDELLRQIPKLIEPFMRKTDVLARLGGDEFGIILEDTNLETVTRIAQSIIDSVKEYQFYWEERVFRIGVSIGMVKVDDSMTVPDEIMRLTDSACYAAKDKGRSAYHLHTQNDEVLMLRAAEMSWVSRIDEALLNNYLVLYAQKIVPVIHNNVPLSYELLVRLQCLDGEIVPPGAFMPAAERYGKMVAIDRWVFESAFRFFFENPAFLESVNYCSINLSAQSLTDKGFLTYLLNKLSENPKNAKHLCIEITETSVISNMNEAKDFMFELKALGVRFALDDFGSGLSSFGYLKSLPVDYLKIDGMFVKDIVDDPIDWAMVKSIHEVGKVMGLQTVAEFVENDMILEELRAIGVNFAQGYGIGKPGLFESVLTETGKNSLKAD